MADSNKEVCKWLERIADQLKSQNRLLKQVAENMEMKQFDEFDPPAVGMAVRYRLHSRQTMPTERRECQTRRTSTLY